MNSDNSAPASVTSKEKCFHLRPVSPLSSGEGLPYAPIDWPCPGNTWSWKVGKRVSKNGYHQDRYLYLPSRLLKPGCWKHGLLGKPEVERYIQKEFPGQDVDAFFATFNWPIPAETKYWPKVTKKTPDEGCEKEKVTQTFQRKRKQIRTPVSTICRKRTRQSFKRLSQSTTNDEFITIDLTEETETSNSTTRDSSTSNSESDQVSSIDNSISSGHSSIDTCRLPVVSEDSVINARQDPTTKLIPKDFDAYMNSLDDILAKSLNQDLSSPHVTNNSHAVENEMAESQTKLTSLLALDFPLLVSTTNFAELTNLSIKLQKDPRLTVDQLLKLKLIEEIPMIGNNFLKTTQIIVDADDFFADLEANTAKIPSLRKNYNESKEKAYMLQAEIDSSSSTIQEIDDQISQLQSRRTEFVDAVKIKVELKNQLIYAQKNVVDTLANIVQKVQLGYSKKQEWEQKKVNAVKLVAEVRARYAPLIGFSL